MRRHNQYDEEAARREPLLGGGGSGEPDGGGGGASRRQSTDDFNRGLSPGRGLSPDRVVSSTPGGAIRLTKRASTVDRVRGGETNGSTWNRFIALAGLLHTRQNAQLFFTY